MHTSNGRLGLRAVVEVKCLTKYENSKVEYAEWSISRVLKANRMLIKKLLDIKKMIFLKKTITNSIQKIVWKRNELQVESSFKTDWETSSDDKWVMVTTIQSKTQIYSPNPKI